MAGDAVDRDLEPRCAVDRGHDPDRQPFGLEGRALLDMSLDEGDDVLRANERGSIGIAAESLSASRISTPSGVPLVERVLRVVSSQSARTGEGGAKANALFVAESHDFNRVIEAIAARGQRFDHCERGQRAIISVVAPRVAHGVDVRAQHESRRAGPLALVASNDIACRVDRRLEPGLAAPADKGLGGMTMRVRQEKPGQASRFVGEGRERLKPRHQPAAGGEIRFR